MEVEDRWTISKHIPIALIATVVAQTIGIAWAASNLWTRVDQLEKISASNQSQAGQIIRLETKVDALTASINEIKALVRK